MAKILRAKAKRKDLEVVHSDLDDYLFASRSKRIKTPEEESIIPLEFEQQLPKEQMHDCVEETRAVMAENIPDFGLKGNGKIFFHEPLDAPVVQFTRSSDVSFRLHSDLISDTKSQYLLPSDPNLMIKEEVPMDHRSVPAKNHFDVVPSMPSQAFITAHVIDDIMSRSNLSEPLEAEEEQDAPMELEENREGQYHMTAQLYASNPVLWSGDEKEAFSEEDLVAAEKMRALRTSETALSLPSLQDRISSLF